MADPIPTGTYHGLTLLTDVAASPSGDRVAFVADEFDGDDERRSALFVVPTDGSRDPHRPTRASDASAPVWSPDGDRLAFLAAREPDATLSLGRPDDGVDGDGDDPDATGDADGGPEDGDLGPGGEGPRTQAWAFDLALGGDARQVTTGEAFPEGVRGLDRGSGGDRFVVDARDPTDLGPYREFERFDLRGGTAAFALEEPSEGKDVAVAPLSELDDDAVDPTRLSALNADLLADHPVPTVRRVTFESDEGDLDAVAYLPAEVDLEAGPDESLPLVVSIHGRPVSCDVATFPSSTRPGARGSTPSSARTTAAVLLRARVRGDAVRPVGHRVGRGYRRPRRVARRTGVGRPGPRPRPRVLLRRDRAGSRRDTNGPVRRGRARARHLRPALGVRHERPPPPGGTGVRTAVG